MWAQANNLHNVPVLAGEGSSRVRISVCPSIAGKSAAVVPNLLSSRASAPFAVRSKSAPIFPVVRFSEIPSAVVDHTQRYKQ